MADYGICSADGCDKAANHKSWRLCQMHEARFRRGGSLDRRVEKLTLAALLGGKSTFGSWTIIGEGEPYRRKSSGEPMRTARARCVCGVERDVAVHTLKQGMSKHCGCQVSALTTLMKTTHDMSRTSEYRSWSHLKERCSNPNCKDYPDYGGRGVSVCASWNDSFESFIADMGLKPDPEHSIDRIDVNGNYEPGNCRWADKLTQARNKRSRLT